MSHHSHTEIDTQIGGAKKTFAAYFAGLVLCIILTLMSFGLVEYRLFNDTDLYIGLAVLAVIQLFVQSLCFLRLNSSPEGRWNLMPFIFSLIIIAVIVGGSLWIMYNMNYNMT